MGLNVQRIKLGSQGLEVSKQGLGCMGMTFSYGQPKSEPEMIELIHHAINSGVTFLDTSDVYGPHTNEILIGKALKGGMREKVQIASKFGIVGTDGKLDICGDPAYVRAACEASLKRLDIDCIDLYYVHRIDTSVPIEVTMGELKKLVEEGKIKYVGLSEASASTIRRAHAVHPITAIQNEWSLWSRDLEQELVPTCRSFLGCKVKILKTTKWYTKRLVKWLEEKVAPRLNWHWLGFITKETTCVLYPEPPRSTTSMRILELSR